ncbi:hypothetical protein D3C80_1568620 [compost metagenome]
MYETGPCFQRTIITWIQMQCFEHLTQCPIFRDRQIRISTRCQAYLVYQHLHQPCVVIVSRVINLALDQIGKDCLDDGTDRQRADLGGQSDTAFRGNV